VQKAFDLYRVLLTPRVLAVLPPRQAARSLAAINACVSYQIHSFSDRFQSMHELAIRRHAQNLEQEVELRNQELAASRKRYKSLVEEINDGYFVVRGLRIEFVNRSFCAMHAGQPDQLLGRHFLNLVARPDRPRVTRSWRDLMTGRPQPKALEYQRQGLNGLGGATEVRARVVDLGQGPVLIGICRDISQRVAMELRVRENQRMADLGQLTASLSHELRNPLATIKMNLQLLQRRTEISPPDQERLGLAVGEMTRLEGILRQLLDAAKPLTPECEPVEVNHLVADCLKLLQPQLSERGQRIRRRLDPGLGRVSLDRGMLEQALINLLLNAMDAAGPGGHITVSSQPLPGEVATGCLLAVRDNGPGLDPAEQEKVFTPFFTRKGHGTGLGLTNLARIAKAHGGAVKVRSRPGRGAKFILEIPGRS
jgi:PAS domain S-box-containing protein